MLSICLTTYHSSDVNKLELLLRSLFTDGINNLKQLYNNELEWIDKINNKVELLIHIDNVDKIPTHINYTNRDFNIANIIELIEEYSRKIKERYNNVVVKYILSETNIGVGNSRNRLIKLATSKYIKFCDCDDISCDINTLLDMIDTYQTDIIMFPYLWLDTMTDSYTRVYDIKSLTWCSLISREMLTKNKVEFVSLIPFEYRPFVNMLLAKTNPTISVSDHIGYYYTGQKLTKLKANVYNLMQDYNTYINTVDHPMTNMKWKRDLIRRIVVVDSMMKTQTQSNALNNYSIIDSIQRSTFSGFNTIYNVIDNRNSSLIVANDNTKYDHSQLDFETFLYACRDINRCVDFLDVANYIKELDNRMSFIYIDGLIKQDKFILKELYNISKQSNNKIVDKYLCRYMELINMTNPTTKNNKIPFISFNEIIEYLISNGESYVLRNYYSINNSKSNTNSAGWSTFVGPKSIEFARRLFDEDSINLLLEKLENFSIKDWLKEEPTKRPDNINLFITEYLSKDL